VEGTGSKLNRKVNGQFEAFEEIAERPSSFCSMIGFNYAFSLFNEHKLKQRDQLIKIDQFGNSVAQVLKTTSIAVHNNFM